MIHKMRYHKLLQAVAEEPVEIDCRPGPRSWLVDAGLVETALAVAGGPGEPTEASQLA